MSFAGIACQSSLDPCDFATESESSVHPIGRSELESSLFSLWQLGVEGQVPLECKKKRKTEKKKNELLANGLAQRAWEQSTPPRACCLIGRGWPASIPRIHQLIPVSAADRQKRTGAPVGCLCHFFLLSCSSPHPLRCLLWLWPWLN